MICIVFVHIIIIMNNEFERLFNDFYVKMTILNYKLKTNTNLSDEDRNVIDKLKLLIPIYNRVSKDDSLTIDKVITTENSSVHDKDINISTYPFDNSDGYSTATTGSLDSDSEEADVEGNKQVDDITEKSLILLQSIKDSTWAFVENEESVDESVDESIDESTDESVDESIDESVDEDITKEWNNDKYTYNKQYSFHDHYKDIAKQQELEFYMA